MSRSTPPTDPSPHTAPAVCPGCGGRNLPGALECDWCRRSFISQGRRLQLAWWQILSSFLLLAVIGSVVALGVLNANRALPVARQTPAAATASPLPTPVVTPRVTAALTPTPRPTPSPPPQSQASVASSRAEPAAPPPTPTPAPRAAQVANTSGLGVMMRAEPGPQARSVGTLREGARVELTGEEQTVAARLWRQVVGPTGVRGWVSSEFLVAEP